MLYWQIKSQIYYVSNKQNMSNLDPLEVVGDATRHSMNLNKLIKREKVVVRAHFSKRGILKVCKAFLSRICHAVVFTQFKFADSKSAPCQALF